MLSAGLPNGVVGTRPGALMTAADALRVTVRGRGGHGSSPHRATDPVPVMAEMITAVQTIVTRHLDPFDPVIITVGKVEAGKQRNVIPDTAHFEATIRSYTPEAARTVEAGLQTLLTNIATAQGVRAEVEYRHEYPPTVNDAEQAAFALQQAREVFGTERVVELDRPVPASEDFSRVLQEVPGACPAPRGRVSGPGCGGGSSPGARCRDGSCR